MLGRRAGEAPCAVRAAGPLNAAAANPAEAVRLTNSRRVRWESAFMAGLQVFVNDGSVPDARRMGNCTQGGPKPVVHNHMAMYMLALSIRRRHA